jgi:ABC-type transport system involved in multi-copper enzyme maturation permease subunit
VTWRVVARRDLRELAADNTLPVFVVLFAVLGGGIAYGSTRVPSPAPLPDALALVVLFAVPLAAGTVTHEAVPRNVSNGRIRLTLSLPHSRREFLAGVGAARLAVVTASTLVSVAAGALVYLVRGGPLDPLGVAALVALAVLLGAAFVAVALALTARSTSTTLAAATTFGFFLLAFAWPVAVAVGRVVLAGQFRVRLPPGTTDTVVQLSPIYAFQNAANALGVAMSAPTGRLPEWAGVVVLVAWSVLAFALAARRFDGIDL